MGSCGAYFMKVGGAWLSHKGTQALFRIYASEGFQIFAVGGCVRNALLHRQTSDIDMASDATPEQAISFLEKANFRVIPTGVDHGTITVISGGIPHEITTFRKDVETDGRHAKVSFSDSIHEDAARRDFTINALYADAQGYVTDPVGGLSDIQGPKIRFIGRPIDRIREDYLRALRFFRFHAQYADQSQGFDPEALGGIAETLDGLGKLSRERVGAEFTKLLAAPDPAPALACMQQTGVLSALLPGAEIKALGPAIHFEARMSLPPDFVYRLSAISDAEIAKSLRLRKADLKRQTHLREAATSSMNASALGFHLKHDGLRAFGLRHAFLEHPISPKEIDAVKAGAKAIFPISAKDLQPEFSGKALGQRLRLLEEKWIASGFEMTKDELLA